MFDPVIDKNIRFREGREGYLTLEKVDSMPLRQRSTVVRASSTGVSFAADFCHMAKVGKG